MGRHKILESALCIILSVSIAGCATMFHGATQQVSIRSNDDDAKLYVNEAYVGKGTGVTTFQKNKNYTIVVRKAGCSDVTAIPTKSFDATTLLGILIDFGIISVLLVDGIGTGAIMQFDQTSYVVDPNCDGHKVEAVNPVQESVQKEEKKASEPTTNFNGGVVNKK